MSEFFKILLIATIFVVPVIIFAAKHFAYLWLETREEIRRTSQKERRQNRKTALEELESSCEQLRLWIEKFTDGFDHRTSSNEARATVEKIRDAVTVHSLKKLRKEMVALEDACDHCHMCWSRFETQSQFQTQPRRFHWNEELEGVDDEGFLFALKDLRDANTAFLRGVAKLKRKL